MTVIFSTYHSIDVISQAQQYGLPEIDLVICDEAHRTTGQTWEGEDESAFVRIHDNALIKAKKRLYMTATPRIYTSEAKEKQSKNNLTLYSMDDESIYGKTLHTLNFSAAVEKNLLVPYKVIVLTIAEKEVDDILHDYLTKHTDQEDKSISVNDAAKIVGCFKALTKQHLTDLTDDPKPMQRAVAFCQIIGEDSKGQPIKTHKTAARHVAKTFSDVVEEYQCNAREDEKVGFDCYVDYIHGGMGAATKNEKLNWLKAPLLENNACRILTNVRCLSEGVDVPALDAVLFLTPRNSQVEVVQSVGRVMRKAPGKKRGYIILPVVIPYDKEPHKALNDNKTYKIVWQVLQALRSHDDEFDRFINRIELLGKDPKKMEVIALKGLASRRKKLTPEQREQREREKRLRRARKQKTIGKPEQTPNPPQPQQDELDFKYSTGELERAILAKVVQKVGNRDYWEQWAQDIARLAKMQINRIGIIINNPENQAACSAFNIFKEQLHQHINNNISQAEIIEMLAQHLITKPVFDALFGGNAFSQNNPMSVALQAVTDILLKDFNLDKEQQSLEQFYDYIRKKTEGIDDPEARQKLIIMLYDEFFASAFPHIVQKHGIVYTPVEIVDFILHSVAFLLKTQFNKTFSDNDVQVLDPFTGTGTFIARLLTSGLIEADKLSSVYQNQLHATEILLLPYYIAAVNIESTYQQCCPDQPYTPFPGILLADTFNIPTKESDDWVENQAQAILAANNKRRRKQMDSKITVIVGNPPYSVGQKNANDNNQNVSYPELDEKIIGTYAKKSKATSKKSLRDSYIRAIRWASDRISKETGGIVGFVTNAGWLDSAACDGLRKCLLEDFSSLYVFHLRGDIKSEIRGNVKEKKEGGNVFGQGSTTGVAISILVKTPKKSDLAVTENGKVYFHDIGDYLTCEQKLQKIAKLGSIAGISMAQMFDFNKNKALSGEKLIKLITSDHKWSDEEIKKFEERMEPVRKKLREMTQPLHNLAKQLLENSSMKQIENLAKITAEIKKSPALKAMNEILRENKEIAASLNAISPSYNQIQPALVRNYLPEIKKSIATVGTQIHSIEVLEALRQIEESFAKPLATLPKIWQPITPDDYGDWLNQRHNDFVALLPLGDIKNKNKPGNTGVFENFSLGIASGRDAWCNNPSQKTLLKNVKHLVDYYENQRKAFQQIYGELDLKQRLDKVNEFIDTNPTKISWTYNLKSDLARNYELIFNPLAVVRTLYRPFSKGWLYYDRRLNERVYQMPQFFPLSSSKENKEKTKNKEKQQGILFPVTPSTQPGILFKTSAKADYIRSASNRLICVSGIGSRSFSVLMTDQIPSLDCIEKGQCFPLYIYNEKGEQKSGITDKTLTTFKQHYSQENVSKEQIFYYIYAILHNNDYCATWQVNLLKELPRIPFAKSFDDFCAFAKAGKQLGDLHCGFESAPIYAEAIIEIHKSGCKSLADLNPQDFYVEKMKYATINDAQTDKKVKDLTVIHYNRFISIKNIPPEAYQYVVNGRPALDWVVDRQGIRTDKASGIVSDSNRYATETVGNPRYPLELLLRVISVSLSTLALIKTLPKLEI